MKNLNKKIHERGKKTGGNDQGCQCIRNEGEKQKIQLSPNSKKMLPEDAFKTAVVVFAFLFAPVWNSCRLTNRTEHEVQCISSSHTGSAETWEGISKESQKKEKKLDSSDYTAHPVLQAETGTRVNTISSDRTESVCRREKRKKKEETHTYETNSTETRTWIGTRVKRLFVTNEKRDKTWILQTSSSLLLSFLFSPLVFVRLVWHMTSLSNRRVNFSPGFSHHLVPHVTPFPPFLSSSSTHSALLISRPFPPHS